MHLKILSESPAHTITIGARLSRILKAGDILLLSGELGGGKTTFVSGLARGLKLKRDISSPSFTILNEYITGKFKLIHIDLYRLEGEAEFENAGIDRYVSKKSGIVCIEWGEKLEKLIKRDYLKIDFKYCPDDGVDKRLITLNWKSKYWDRKLKRFKGLIKNEEGLQ
jgi:tRNA threonylcarbamoyladenosine biosynthesis protein TsaE